MLVFWINIREQITHFSEWKSTQAFFVSFLTIFILEDSAASFSAATQVHFLFSYLRKNRAIQSWNFANAMRTMHVRDTDIAET